MTIRQLISKIRNEMNSVTLDDRISNRYIWSKVIDVFSVLFRRNAGDRKIFSLTEMYSVIECFELKKESANNCTNIMIPNCNNYMKSILDIPESVSTTYSNSFIVETIDGYEIKKTTPALYKNIINRRFISQNYYYWIYENKLVIPDHIEAVRIKYIKNFSFKLSKQGMDEEIKIPSWIEFDLVKLIITDLRNRKNIPVDEDPNNNNHDKT